MDKTEVIEQLPIKEVNVESLEEQDFKSLYEQKSNALILAEETNKILREQLKKQVDTYNTDMKQLSDVLANHAKYKNAKEEAVTKVLTGLLDLINLDNMSMLPETEGGSKNAN